jgi:Fe2+ or Zn2+ uptake regulation protein
MKGKLMIAVMAFGLVVASCGETTELKENKEAQIEKAKDLGAKIDELNLEIEAIDLAGEEIDATINELDNI